MIPNSRMGYYHQGEYLERPYNIRMSEKAVKKPLRDSLERLEYSSLLTSKTYSILSYIVGGFVGSKSQMNNNKHNLSYDLSAAVFNLLNPCKYDRDKCFRKSNENFYNTAAKISRDGYEKYIVKSSQKEKMFDLRLEWLEDYVFGFQEECYNSDQTKNSFNCDDSKVSSDSQSTIDDSQLKNFVDDSVDVTDRVFVGQNETSEEKCISHSSNYIANERFRQQSECSIESTDSESFIVFGSPDQDDEKKIERTWKLENFDLGSEEGNDDNDEDIDINGDDNSSCDEYDMCSLEKELAEANDKWKRNYENVKTQENEEQRKVRFNDDVKVNKIVAWDYAYRAARPGPWEQMARDRVRFREKILRLSSTLSPILRKEHREKIYKELYS